MDNITIVDRGTSYGEPPDFLPAHVAGVSVVDGEMPIVLLEFEDENLDLIRIGLCPTCMQKLVSIVKLLQERHPQIFDM